MKQEIITTLADFAHELRFEDLPADVVGRANDCLFDVLGCYFAELKQEQVRGILRDIAAFNPSQQSQIWGTEYRCGIAEAALAIGTAAYHLEYDDGISVSGHWGSASIPASLLAVIAHGGNGKDALTALVTGYEVGDRISRMFSPQLLKRHVHFPCTMGAFGAAAGYAKGAQAPANVLAGALALAGLFPVGTYSTAISGAKGKGLYSGWPNYLGVNAVRLSAAGLTGDLDIMEAPDGFARAFGLPPVTEEQLVGARDGLGKAYSIMKVYFKPYPCCRWLHAPVHAVEGLMKKHKLRHEDIRQIDIGVPEFAMMYNTRTGFDSKVTCQYSIPYSVGAAIYCGQLGLEQYEPEIRGDRQLHAYIDRIQMHVDAELQDQFPAAFSVRVRLTLRDGTAVSAQEGTPWGPDSPPSQTELIRKFKSLTENILSPQEQTTWVRLYQSGFERESVWPEALRLLHQPKGEWR